MQIGIDVWAYIGALVGVGSIAFGFGFLRGWNHGFSTGLQARHNLLEGWKYTYSEPHGDWHEK